VVLVALYGLARTLSTTPPSAVILPILASNSQDLEALTRMVGDIELDSSPTENLPEELAGRLASVDSLIALGEWHPALDRLRRLRRPPEGSAKAVIEEYAGFCHYRSVRPDHALHSFREAMAADSGRDRERQFRLAFAAGYLFQSRGFADSALALYSTARYYAPAPPEEPDSAPGILAALLNNFGLARETTGDTAAALELYRSAAAMVDTSVDDPGARTVRDNLRRLSR